VPGKCKKLTVAIQVACRIRQFKAGNVSIYAYVSIS